MVLLPVVLQIGRPALGQHFPVLPRAVESQEDEFVVVEPGQRSVQTAHTIQRLAADIGIQRIYVVGNKVRSPEERAFVEQAVGDLPLLGVIPFSLEVLEADRKGMALYDLGGPAVDEIRRIRQELDRRLESR